MSVYIPTTEQVRLDYVMAYTERESSQALAERDFDRWYAAEIRRAKAEGLREAATELRTLLPFPSTTRHEIVHALEKRAERFEAKS